MKKSNGKKAKSLRANAMSDNPIEVRRPSPYATISKVPPAVTPVFTVRVTTQTGALLTATPTSAQAPTYQFTLADLDNSGAYTSMFDQYKIECVAFHLLPMQNAIGLQTNSTTTTVTPYVIVDYDDATAITSAGDARSFESCVIVAPGKECYRQFAPRVAMAAYSGSFTSYANVKAPWIDCASASVNHYGVKLYIPGATAAQTQLQSWTVERTYWVSFRKLHG